MDINERARTDPRSSRSIFDHTSARTAVAAALLCLAAAAPACPDLTGADAVTPGSRFLLDNEGYAATPWNLQISGVGANGDVTGTMTTNVYGGTTYPVFGTVSGSGTLEIAFTYVVGGIPGITFDGVTYSYNGAIMYADAACDLFIAGAYTSTYYTFEETRFGPLPVANTSAPMPFSGLWEQIFW